MQSIWKLPYRSKALFFLGLHQLSKENQSAAHSRISNAVSLVDRKASSTKGRKYSHTYHTGFYSQGDGCCRHSTKARRGQQRKDSNGEPSGHHLHADYSPGTGKGGRAAALARRIRRRSGERADLAGAASEGGCYTTADSIGSSAAWHRSATVKMTSSSTVELSIKRQVKRRLDQTSSKLRWAKRVIRSLGFSAWFAHLRISNCGL